MTLEELIKQVWGSGNVYFISIGHCSDGVMASVRRNPSVGFSCYVGPDPVSALRKALEAPPTTEDPKAKWEEAKRIARGEPAFVPAPPATNVDEDLFG